MKKGVYYFVACTYSCIMFSCSSVPTEREVTVSDVDISGTIKDFVKVVDGDYKFTNKGREAFITVKFELVKNSDCELCRKKHPEDIRINPINEDGAIFDTGVYGFTASRTEMSKLKELLNKGKIGDTKNISFKWEYFGQHDELGGSIFKESASFEVIDETFNCCNNLNASDLHWDDKSADAEASTTVINAELINDEPEEEIIVKKSTENWDKILDSYEKYVDQYIKYMKKIKDGDMSVMTEYASLLEKTTDLGEKMEKAKGELSSKQMKRYLEITNKFTMAMVDMAQ